MLGIFVAAASSVFCKLGLEATGPSDILSCVGGLAFSYIFTDFAVGWYHHAVDNYGSENTPIFGCTIRISILHPVKQVSVYSALRLT